MDAEVKSSMEVDVKSNMEAEVKSNIETDIVDADYGGDLMMLMDNAQIHKLALLLRNNEEALMMRVMKSQYERIEYLKSVNDSYDYTMKLLNDSTELAAQYAMQDSEEKARISEDVLDYVKYGLNMSMQNVRNCCLRVSCIEKISDHYKSLVKELADLDPNNLTNIRKMAKDVSLYKQCMWEYSSKCRSGSARAMSKAFSMVLKQEGITFPKLCDRHKNKLGFIEDFDSLDDARKLKVYNSIIEDSGRAKVPKLEIASTAVGVALLVATAGIMVWDIFTAEHKLEAILRNSLAVLSEIGAIAVQVAVEAAVTVAVANLQLGVFLVSMAGFVVGAIAGLLFVTVSGALLDWIFGNGGNAAPPVTDLQFHTAEMPDGLAFANQIAHDS